VDRIPEELYTQTIGARGVSFGPIDAYRAAHRGHVVVENACLATRELGPLWDGDLDLTVKEAVLQTLAEMFELVLYVLPAAAACADAGSGSKKRLLHLKQAVVAFQPDGEVELDLLRLDRDIDGRIYERGL
jgi:hypothetical protein